MIEVTRTKWISVALMAAERDPGQQAGGDADDAGHVQARGKPRGEVLRDRGGGGEGDVDAAGDQHHEQAECEDALHRVGLDQIDEVGDREEAGRDRGQHRADHEDHREQPRLMAPAQALRHRPAPAARLPHPAGDRLADDAPAAHVQHPVAGREHFLDLVGDQQDADALGGEPAHDLVDALLVADVHADGRAVENEHLRAGGEPLRQHHALLVAAGERVHGMIEAGDADVQPRPPSAPRSPRRCAVLSRPSAPRSRSSTASTMLSLDRLAQIEARDSADPRRDRRCRRGSRPGWSAAAIVVALDGDRAGVGAGHAEQRQRQLGAAGAEQAGDAEHLARREA